MGQQTYMARIDASGQLITYEQVITIEKFAAIRLGAATKADVLRIIGAPSERTYFALSDLEAWSYPYKEKGIWNSIMHVHFDKTGIVRKMLNGRDFRFDAEMHWPFKTMR